MREKRRGIHKGKLDSSKERAITIVVVIYLSLFRSMYRLSPVNLTMIICWRLLMRRVESDWLIQDCPLKNLLLKVCRTVMAIVAPD